MLAVYKGSGSMVFHLIEEDAKRTLCGLRVKVRPDLIVGGPEAASCGTCAGKKRAQDVVNSEDPSRQS